MTNTKLFKCPFCNRKYLDKNALYDHMYEEHNLELNNQRIKQCFPNLHNSFELEVQKTYLLLKDYGETWALTKEELEK